MKNQKDGNKRENIKFMIKTSVLMKYICMMIGLHSNQFLVI